MTDTKGGDDARGRHRVVVTGVGAITPLGGLAFLAGWACLAFAAI